MIIERARELRKQIELLAENLNDETALDNKELFPNWDINVEYEVNKRVHYGDNLYRCVQTHTSQANWNPSQTPALWTRVFIEEWPEWVQPSGAQDAYMINDKVSHNEKHWINTIDYNTWEPGVYGWDEVTE